jgi:PAS domain S-box-containing protein
MSKLHRLLLDYLLAIAVTALAIFFRWLLNPFLDHRLPFITLYGAIAVAVWSGGWRPAIVSTFLGYVAAQIMFVENEPGSPLSLFKVGGTVGAIVYLGTCMLVIGLGHGMRKARRRAEALAEDALAGQRVLEKKDAELQLITARTPVLLARCDKDLRYVFVNRAGADFLGRPPDQIIGKPIREILGDEAFATIEPYIRRALEGETLQFESLIPYSGAGPRFVRGQYTPDRNENGDIIGWIATIHDITEQKNAENALSESELRFRLMADAAPVLIWISGTDKGCTWFNKAWLEFVGRSMEQEIGNGWAENVHPADFDRCLEIYTTSFDARQPFTMEYRLKRHDGEYRWVLDNGVPLYAPVEGKFSGFIGSCIDITEKEQSATSLRRAKDRLAGLVDSAMDAIVSVDEQQRIILFNPAAERMFGYPASAVVGKSLDLLIPNRFRDAHASHITSFGTTGTT